MKSYLLLVLTLIPQILLADDNSKTCVTIDRNGNQVTREVGANEDCPSEQSNGSSSSGSSRRQAGGSDPRVSAVASGCKSQLERWRTAYVNGMPTVDAAAPAAPLTEDQKEVNRRSLEATASPELKSCRAYEIVSKSNSASLTTTDSKTTADGIATCKMKAGFTSDYDSCTSTASVYDSIVALEKILLSTQSVRNAQNQQKVQTTAAQQTVDGDGQNAIYDAALADYQFKKGLGQEQLMAYTAAVAAMGAKISSWKTKCGGVNVNIRGGATPADRASQLPNIQAAGAAGGDLCQTALDKSLENDARDTRANNDAKQAFSAALVGFLQKAVAAKAAIDRLNMNSATVATAKDLTNSASGGPVFEKCVVTPLDPECVQRSGRQAAAGFSQGDFNIGEGTGNNAFDLGSDTGTTGDSAIGSGSDGNGSVAGVASPFGDQAKNANDILDPAAAAQISPGGGAGAGGGGVGGGLGGGGSASLGNDLKGEDKDNKQEDIKANKLAGNYNSVGGKGFSAIAGSKEENPFKSLFDEKNGGGIEEDRSIASESGPRTQPLFERITSRYKQVSADKRIEAMNLE